LFIFAISILFPMQLRLIMGSDHAGFEAKQALFEWLVAHDYDITDLGPQNAESVDYPDFAHPVAMAVENGHADLGILLCGSGNGVAMTANKHQDIRAALCWNNEIAGLARQHNNANVICIPARFVSIAEVQKMVKTFVETKFEGGRHERRVEKMACPKTVS
jgi:ribose 5-phosphate isomerase B